MLPKMNPDDYKLTTEEEFQWASLCYQIDNADGEALKEVFKQHLKVTMIRESIFKGIIRDAG